MIPDHRWSDDASNDGHSRLLHFSSRESKSWLSAPWFIPHASFSASLCPEYDLVTESILASSGISFGAAERKKK